MTHTDERHHMTLQRHLLCLSFAATLVACNPTTVVCRAGTERCGAGCADFTSDNRNCGACGQACAVGQACVMGACSCQPGTTACGDTCAVTENDPSNCGGCGQACATGEVCEAGQCSNRCSAGLAMCNLSCVNVATSAQHCGGCGQACQSAQRCQAGRCTYDFVAACFRTGQLVGMSAVNYTRGVLTDFGNGPGALTVMEDTVLGLDGIDNVVYQAVASAQFNEASQVLSQRRLYNAAAAIPNQAVVEGERVFVANAGAGTLQVLKKGAGGGLSLDAGVEGGISMGTVGELAFGPNTYPQGLVVVGQSLWVPLYGGGGAVESAQGQRVVRVDISQPDSPRDGGSFSLAGLDLHAFDGGASLPRPWAITARGTVVYVALNNLAPDYSPGGPGLLARIDTGTQAITGVDLGSACLNPQWVSVAGDSVVVSCGGKVLYDSTYKALGTTGAGAAIVNMRDEVTGRWSADCAMGDSTCQTFLPGRFAVRDGKMWIADQNSGRVAVLDVSGGTMTPVRVGAEAVAVCPGEMGTNLANVADVLALP